MLEADGRRVLRLFILSSFSKASISSVEAGRMTVEAVSYSLRQTVFGILKTLVVRASQNNLDLTYDVQPDIPTNSSVTHSACDRLSRTLSVTLSSLLPQRSRGRGTLRLVHASSHWMTRV